MGKLNITASTGIGVISDEATAILNDVVKGKTALTSDSKDELGLGTLELTGTTTPSHVLIGDSFYNTNVHIKETGTMPNNPAQNANLNCGQSKVIPAGYNPGGTVQANSLASQTSGATATDAFVRQGYTYWKDGIKRTGTMAVSSVVSFSVAAYSTSQVLCTWKNPAKAPYSGFAICGKEGGYPANVGDNRRYTGAGGNSALNATNTAIIGGLTPGKTYYFRIWVYATCSSGDLYSTEYKQAAGKPAAHGRQVFNSSGTFIVPTGIRSVDVFCVGGGGGGGFGGGRANSGSYFGGGGGGGGYTATKLGYAIDPKSVLNVEVGAGGPPDSDISSTQESGRGSASSVTHLGTMICQAGGGGGCQGGHSYYNAGGGDGGSAGGGGITESNTAAAAGGGGSNGGRSNYYWAPDIDVDCYSGGDGQGTTTREFGETTGTLYSGGGGGGASGASGAGCAPGGAGGGGWGAAKNPSRVSTSGNANTGGGGGGGCYPYHDAQYGSNGGSGVVIIRW